MSFHSWMVRSLLHPVDCIRQGNRAQLRYEREYERTQYLSPDDLAVLRLSRIRELVSHAVSKCSYYRQRFADAGISPRDLNSLEDVGKLPILEKRELQNHRDDFVSKGWPKDDLHLDQTGGSTGQPTSYFLSRDRICSRNAAAARHNAWAGYYPGDKVAFIWGASPDIPDDHFKQRIKNFLVSRSLYLDTGHIREDELSTFNSKLKEFRPKIIQAYSNSLVLLARYLNDAGQQAYQPCSIISSAEVLAPENRQLVEECFGCPVFDRYGSREFSVIASECGEHCGMHVMAEGLYLEIVCGDRVAQPGEIGEILITDLLNFAMPMIRYRIGDMARVEDQPCACGRFLPRIRDVAGRVTDFVVGLDGRLVSGVYLATYVVSKRPQLGQVQIWQDAPGHIVYKIAQSKGRPEAEDLDYLRSETERFLGEGSVVEFQMVDQLPRLPSGKIHFCQSSVKPEYNNGP